MFKRFSNFKSVCYVLLVALMTATGCDHSDPLQVPEEAHPPALPKVSTMKMDLSFFENSGVDQASIQNRVPSPDLASQCLGKCNFINAAMRVLFVQLVAYAALEPPVAAFLVAFHSVPQPQPDGSWLWTYIFVDGEIEYSIYLRGKQYDDYTEWSMRVSCSDPEMPLDHFLWFEGEAQNDERSGYWQFYEPADDIPVMTLTSTSGELETPGVPSVRIDWENLPENTHTLMLLVNKAGSPHEGDTVEFFESSAMCYLEFFDASEEQSGNITWYPDGSGSIEMPDYNNGEKACWDEHQNDVDCSE